MLSGILISAKVLFFWCVMYLLSIIELTVLSVMRGNKFFRYIVIEESALSFEVKGTETLRELFFAAEEPVRLPERSKSEFSKLRFLHPFDIITTRNKKII